jgi:hypothetical protein
MRFIRRRQHATLLKRCQFIYFVLPHRPVNRRRYQSEIVACGNVRRIRNKIPARIENAGKRPKKLQTTVISRRASSVIRTFAPQPCALISIGRLQEYPKVTYGLIINEACSSSFLAFSCDIKNAKLFCTRPVRNETSSGPGSPSPTCRAMASESLA